MANGLDTASTITQATATAIVNAGYTFVVRYYATSASSWKVMQQAEAKRLSDNGIWVVSVFQDSNNSSAAFSTSKGNSNAESAYNYAKNTIGQPTGTPIYFAVDYDAQSSDRNGVIKDYFTAIKNKFSSLGGEYKVGVYGSGSVCSAIKDTWNLAEFSWLAMASAWSGTSTYTNWNLKQKSQTTINNVTFDTDESAAAGGGGWKI